MFFHNEPPLSAWPAMLGTWEKTFGAAAHGPVEGYAVVVFDAFFTGRPSILTFSPLGQQ